MRGRNPYVMSVIPVYYIIGKKNAMQNVGVAVSQKKSRLEQLRQQDGISLVWRCYVLDSFVTSNVTSAFLDLIRQDMEVVKAARFTAVVRFMYTDQGVNRPRL